MMLSAMHQTHFFRLAELKSQVDRVLQQSLNMKMELSRLPMLEEGTGKMVNLLA